MFGRLDVYVTVTVTVTVLATVLAMVTAMVMVTVTVSNGRCSMGLCVVVLSHEVCAPRITSHWRSAVIDMFLSLPL